LCRHHGRFLREDPLSFTAGDTNLYRYVFNSPNNLNDPTGEIVPLIIIIAVAGVGTAVATAGVAEGINNGPPGFWENFIPFWGPGRSLGHHWANQQWGWVAFDVAWLGLEYLFFCKLAGWAAGRIISALGPGTITVVGRQGVFRTILKRELHDGDLTPSKLQHIFGKAEHRLDQLLAQFGGNQKALLRAVHRAAVEELERIRIVNLEELMGNGIPVTVNGVTVWVQGNIVDGYLRIGTMMIRP
jgi:hypothetical protein